MARAPLLRVLTVGDGDLSFSLALCRALGAREHPGGLAVTATTYIDEEELVSRYDCEACLAELRGVFGCKIRHRVDATRLDAVQPPLLEAEDQFDIIVFNYPHCGNDSLFEDPGSPALEQALGWHARRHCALLAHFLASSRRLLSPGGQVQLLLSREQPAVWRLEESAERLGYHVLQRSPPKAISSFLCGPFAEFAESLREPASGAAAQRRWRNGALGDIHWASRWGYEHRRHDSMGTMHVGSSVNYVLALQAQQQQQSLHDSGLRCAVCDLQFSTSEELSGHIEFAVPDAVASPACAAPGSVRKLNNRTCQAPHRRTCEAPSPSLGTAEPLRVDVTAEHLPTRLKHFLRDCPALRKLLPSSADRKQVLRQPGWVLVNRAEVEDSRWLQEGDVVTLALEASALQRRREELTGEARLDVRYRDAEVAIVWKPAGIRTCGVHKGTLETALPWALSSNGTIIDAEMDIGETLAKPVPISRVQTLVGGLVVVALTRSALCRLETALADGRVLHIFRVLLAGQLSSDVAASLTQFPRRWGQDLVKKGEIEAGKERARDMSVEVRLIDSAPGLSTVDVRTGFQAGKICQELCALFRGVGVPVLGDHGTSRAGGNAGGGQNASKDTRQLQVICHRIELELPAQHGGVAHRVEVEVPEFERFARLRRQAAAGKLGPALD